MKFLQALKRASCSSMVQSWVWFFLGCLVLLFIPLIRAGNLYDYQDSIDGVHLPKVDAIVCLAGGRGRIAGAGDLWYRYWEMSRTSAEGGVGTDQVPILYIAGMGPKANWNVVLSQLRSGVRGVIQPENVVIENESFNTQANAQWFVRSVARMKLKRVILVTSPYHMRRAQLIFEKLLSVSEDPVKIDTLSIFQEPFDPDEWMTSLHGVHVTLVEYLKWLYYRYFWSL